MEEYDNNVRPDIPGLVETEKSRKGKKKGGANKKTLSLQTFLQDESQEANLDSAGQSETENIEAHFAKLNLDDEELIVMESCHSYFHDILRKMGPTNAMDARLQQEMDSFPPEAKVRDLRRPARLVLTSSISESHPEVWWIQKLYPQIQGSRSSGQNCGCQSRSKIGSRDGI